MLLLTGNNKSIQEFNEISRYKMWHLKTTTVPLIGEIGKK